MDVEGFFKTVFNENSIKYLRDNEMTLPKIQTLFLTSGFAARHIGPTTAALAPSALDIKYTYILVWQNVHAQTRTNTRYRVVRLEYSVLTEFTNADDMSTLIRMSEGSLSNSVLRYTGE